MFCRSVCSLAITQLRIANSTSSCTLAITLAAFFSCALFDELEQAIHENISFLHNKKAPEPSVSFGSVESSDALFQFCVYNTLKHIIGSFPVETNV